MIEPPPPTARRLSPRQAAALGAVLLVALAARLGVAARAEAIAQDGVTYLQMARRLAAGRTQGIVEKFAYPPGYPAAVSLVGRATGAESPEAWIRAGMGVSIAMSLVALAAMYWIARATFGHGAAIATVLILGLSGGYTQISCDVLSDSTAAAMVLVSVALGAGALGALRRRSPRALLWAVGAGLAAGAGYLTRPEAMLGAIVAGVLMLLPRKLGARGRALQGAALAALVVGVLAAALPYAITIGGFTQKKTLSDFVFSAGGPSMLAVAPGPGATRLIEAVRRTLDRGRAAVGTTIAVLTLGVLMTWGGKGLFRIPLPKSVVIKPTVAGAIMIFLPASILMPVVTALEMAQGGRYISSRHMLLVGLFASPCAGAAVMILAAWSLEIARRLRVRQIPALAVGGWGAVVVIVQLFQALPVLHEKKGCYRQAGAAIRARIGPGRAILAADPRIAFHAGAPTDQFLAGAGLSWSLTEADLGDLLRRASHTHRDAGYAATALTTPPPPGLQANRFVPLGVFQSSRKDKVWAFLGPDLRGRPVSATTP